MRVRKGGSGAGVESGDVIDCAGEKKFCLAVNSFFLICQEIFPGQFGGQPAQSIEQTDLRRIWKRTSDFINGTGIEPARPPIITRICAEAVGCAISMSPGERQGGPG
jgi:hypothetical protein